MRKLIFLLLVLCFSQKTFSQTSDCKRDSSILTMPADVIMLPRFYDATNFPDTATAPACINEFYNMYATLRIPETFPTQFGPVPLDSIVLQKTGAVTGLPNGLTYTCDPPNCVFKKLTLGCIRLFGTPTADNPIKTYALAIKLKAYTPSFPGVGFDLNFPLNASQGFYIRLRPTGQCKVSSNDLPEMLSEVSNQPNPFSGETLINIESKVNDRFQFEVFDMVGNRLHSENLQISAGTNQFTFEAGNLPAGVYFYTIGNEKGKAARRMVIE